MAKYYAVKVGRKTGIFETWDECKGYVSGYPGALYKSFKSMSEASEYMGWSGEQISMFDFDTLPSKEDGTIDFTTKESELVLWSKLILSHTPTRNMQQLTSTEVIIRQQRFSHTVWLCFMTEHRSTFQTVAVTASWLK